MIKKISLMTVLAGFSGKGMAQAMNNPPDDTTTYPFVDYWPLWLVPIFVIVIYRLWKGKKSGKS